MWYISGYDERKGQGHWGFHINPQHVTSVHRVNKERVDELTGLSDGFILSQSFTIDMIDGKTYEGVNNIQELDVTEMDTNPK